ELLIELDSTAGNEEDYEKTEKTEELDYDAEIFEEDENSCSIIPGCSTRNHVKLRQTVVSAATGSHRRHYRVGKPHS
ncbi:MAG: hypothetical protein ACWGQW_19305, partial [bacterium]